jgi:hypothetical protein
MSHVFISHVEEDQPLAQRIAEYLKTQHYRAWYYERDSVPGVSYLIQTGEAIQCAVAVLLIVWLANCYFAHNSLEFPVLLARVYQPGRRNMLRSRAWHGCARV